MNNRLDSRFAAVDGRFEEMNNRLDNRFAEINSRFNEMGNRYSVLIVVTVGAWVTIMAALITALVALFLTR